MLCVMCTNTKMIHNVKQWQKGKFNSSISPFSCFSTYFFFPKSALSPAFPGAEHQATFSFSGIMSLCGRIGNNSLLSFVQKMVVKLKLSQYFYYYYITSESRYVLFLLLPTRKVFCKLFQLLLSKVCNCILFLLHTYSF